MDILYGNDVVKAMSEQIKNELDNLSGYIPHLAIVRVGERPDDMAYEKGAVKRFEKLGLRCTVHSFPADIGNQAFSFAFADLNADNDVDGILLLRPLPRHIDEKAITEIINPIKDVDCISPINIAKVFSSDEDGFAPCTAEAVMEMITFARIDLTGKRATVVGRSMVIGKPVAMMLMKKNATVTVCHTRTVDMETACRNAEVLVAAAGRAKMINRNYVSAGTYVFDVGINVDESGNMCGDVDIDDISDAARLCTPVPKGVGTVTTSVLAKHVIKAAKMRREQ
ncbi:MAG: bifunctional 5,10-methylenetetrahydrofolate dehydrogenase/5,10-methenyltetrahydrofolate cyclohydrolase [Clostridia bacterium]|jgi:methylenetetrahydrofolate dehydrogenase (NADP+)/methenyltetrahydrofolate cyclohydrolase